jgi:hypothetical protein
MKHGKAASFYYRVGADGRTPTARAEDVSSEAARRRLSRAQRLEGYAVLVQLVCQRRAELQAWAKVTTSAEANRRPVQLSLF